MSWLKKNEMDLKRHVQDLRDNIRNNWSTTGQELSRELRQYWPASRPQSPAPSARTAYLQQNGDGLPPRGRLSIEMPTTPGGTPGQPQSNEFITGYALGLVGGVRSWVCYSRYRSCQSSPFANLTPRR